MLCEIREIRVGNARNEHHNRRNTMNFNRKHQSQPQQPSMNTPTSHNATAEKLVKYDKSVFGNGILVTLERSICVLIYRNLYPEMRELRLDLPKLCWEVGKFGFEIWGLST